MDGRPASGAQVVLQGVGAAEGNPIGAIVGANGSFEISKLPEGSHKVVVSETPKADTPASLALLLEKARSKKESAEADFKLAQSTKTEAKANLDRTIILRRNSAAQYDVNAAKSVYSQAVNEEGVKEKAALVARLELEQIELAVAQPNDKAKAALERPTALLLEIARAKKEFVEAEFKAAHGTKAEAKANLDRAELLLANKNVTKLEVDQAKKTLSAALKEEENKERAIIVATLELEQAQLIVAQAKDAPAAGEKKAHEDHKAKAADEHKPAEEEQDDE